MGIPTADEIIKVLGNVIEPTQELDVITLDMVTGLQVKNEGRGVHVSFSIEVDPKQGAQLEGLRQESERIVAALPGVLSVTAVLTAHKAAPKVATRNETPTKQRQISIDGVEHIIAVASGKGGVGKSTTAVNLAMALAANGQRVGLLDADIYGPSIPRMLAISQKPEVHENKKLSPIMRHNVAVMSMGFLIAEDTPMIWRGPMVQSAIQQMLRDVAWPALDVLVVDMPPGTGDAQLTLAQQVALSGAVIVSTPQDIALLDARKGLNMFRRVEVPVLGMIENMSFFICPHCNGRSDIFSHGGARHEAEKLACDFLGEIPIDLDIRMTSDQGTPIVVSKPDSAQAKIYRGIASAVWAKLSQPQQRQAPKIAVE
jgi:ATP-binding protein involved in chromosome partitioning